MVLDLSKADTSGFEPMDSGTYDATVFEVTLKETKGGPEAKLPKGTPMWNVQFRIGNQTKPEYENRRCFRQYVIAPARVDGKVNDKKAVSDGMIVKLLTDMGYNEDDVKSGKFNPDFADMAGRPVRVTVKKKIKYGSNPDDNEFDNEVVGTKPASGSTTGGIE